MWLALLLFAGQSGLGIPPASIAYLSGTDPDDRALCVLDPVRREVIRIGNGRRDGAPRWSPDGFWIAYSTSGEDGIEMRIVRPNGSETRTVSAAYGWNDEPRWSRDGRLLAYAAGDGLQKWIMVYELESGRESQWGGSTGGLWRPVWLPRNDLLLLLTSEEDAGWLHQLLPQGKQARDVPTLLAMGVRGLPGALTTELMLVTEYGAAPLPATVLPSPEPYEEWAGEPAPDGMAVAFESNDGGDREIFLLTKRGAADISNDHAADWNPVWSPDGRWLAFESFRGGMRGIYRIGRESVRVIPVAVDAAADCWAPTWSSDSNWLAYVATSTGNQDIFAVNVETGETAQLTESPGEDLAPDWSPAVSR